MTEADFFCPRNVRAEDGAACWVWLRGKTASGYGYAYIGGRQWLAHRVSYMLCVGEVPTGLALDHLCRNRACVNPSHLEAVTHRENLLRGVGFSAINAAKTHCPLGHKLASGNLVLCLAKKGHRRCLICARMAAVRYTRKKRGFRPYATR